ncbi:hypothetical protein ANCCAN_16868 [Ancylostoma caninum]|uniref:Uncharacterized protein n=1 Tax=Ancylostoma caninum TaxID=29170 RepID=A0A368G3N3_ANCCA|nr:hypothetical protein ANCCAN_16868 [Ancylostoma caninum]
MDLLKQIRQKIGYHVCFLRGCRDTVPSFENGIAVIPLPDFRGRHYQEILSENNPDEMSSLGFAAGAALHEIGHLLGAFHSSHGIMSERPNAIKMLRNGMDGQTEGLPDCYFDNSSLCLFAHGPFFNEPKDRSTCSPVLFKTSDKEVYLKCKDGIRIVVVINEMLRNGMDGQTEGLPPDCYFDNYSLCLFAHGPFFNEPKDRSTCSPVLFKTSDKEVYLKCKDGILIVVVINDTAYRDLQIFNTMQTSAKLSIEERDWDLIQVYTSSYRVQHITK